MEYNSEKKEIILNREISELDKFVLDFISILEKYADYVIISGYISILLGRSRATEDVDLFLEKINYKKFLELYNDVEKKGFWCLNTSSCKDAFDFLEQGYAIRFARKGESIPNFEVKFPKRILDKETFKDFINVFLQKRKIKISSLERQIVFKEVYLMSDKDNEDAEHIRILFGEKINKDEIERLKKQVEEIKKQEGR